MRSLLIVLLLFFAAQLAISEAIGQDFYSRYTYGWRGSSPYLYGGFIHPPADYRTRLRIYRLEPLRAVEYHHHEHYHYHAAPAEMLAPSRPCLPSSRRWLW